MTSCTALDVIDRRVARVDGSVGESSRRDGGGLEGRPTALAWAVSRVPVLSARPLPGSIKAHGVERIRDCERFAAVRPVPVSGGVQAGGAEPLKSGVRG